MFLFLQIIQGLVSRYSKEIPKVTCPLKRVQLRVGNWALMKGGRNAKKRSQS
jgi:hypothetical protein